MCAGSARSPVSGVRAAPSDHAVTELALILGIEAGGLAFAAVVGRALSRGGRDSTRFERLASALDRAGRAVLARSGRDVAFLALAAAAVLLVLHGYVLPLSSRLSPLQAGFLGALSVLLGSGLGCVVAFAATRFGVRAGVQAAHVAKESLDKVLLLAVRFGGSVGLAVEALAFIGLALLFGVTFALKGGTTLDANTALALAQEIALVLPGFALGAALTALVVQRAAGTYRAASEVAASLALELDAGLSRDDPRNPGLVGEVTGNQLGGHAAGAALAFALAGATHLSAFLLAARLVADGAPVAGLFLPFVVRALFVVACGFGVAVVRTREMENPSLALLRGQASSALIGLVALLGTASWLGGEHTGLLFFGGFLGVAGSLLATVPSLVGFLRRRELGPDGEPLRAGFAAFGGLGVGLETALVPAAALAALILFAAQSPPESGAAALLAGLAGLSALSGLMPLAVAVGTVRTTATTARALGALGGSDPEAQRRVQRLEETRLAALAARAGLVLTAGTTTFFAALAVPGLASLPPDAHVNVLEPVVLCSGVLGAALVLAYAGASARSALSGAHGLYVEIERQIRGIPQNSGLSRIPEDFSPSYKVCVDAAERLARRRLLTHVVGAFGAPVAFVLGIRLLGGTEAAEGLAGFVVAAGFTGFAAALTLDAAHAVLSWQRPARAAGDAPMAAAGEALALVLGHSAGPAAHALVLATACTALTIAPFLG